MNHQRDVVVRSTQSAGQQGVRDLGFVDRSPRRVRPGGTGADTSTPTVLLAIPHKRSPVGVWAPYPHRPAHLCPDLVVGFGDGSFHRSPVRTVVRCHTASDVSCPCLLRQRLRHTPSLAAALVGPTVSRGHTRPARRWVDPLGGPSPGPSGRPVGDDELPCPSGMPHRWDMTAALVGVCHVLTALGRAATDPVGRSILACGGFATMAVAVIPLDGAGQSRLGTPSSPPWRSSRSRPGRRSPGGGGRPCRSRCGRG